MNSSSTATLPYIGSKISLITNVELRYEGTLYSINTKESTVALENVKSFGTEGRRQPEVQPSSKTYNYIIFNGRDIKDLTVCETCASLAEDPAILTVNMPPIVQPGYHTGRGGRGGGGGGRYYQRNDRGRGRNWRNNQGDRRIVGELQPQHNSSTKKECMSLFDFDDANAKFDKDAENNAIKQIDGDNQCKGYDKDKSFFDNISGDINRKKAEYTDRQRQKQLDCETFGASAASVGRQRRARGWRTYRDSWNITHRNVT